VTRLFLAVYAVVLAVLLPRLSLWLDEILTLAGVRQPDLASLISYIETFAGGTLLAFAAPRAVIEVVGYSVFAARLASALASVAACVGVYVLARRLAIGRPLVVVAVFALCPLQFRYAMEVRPYSLALALSIWATVTFFAMQDEGRRRRGWLYAAYAALAMAGGLALAYSLFVIGAHAAWAIVNRKRAVAVACAASLAAGGLALLPWYLHFQPHWAAVTADMRLGGWNEGALGVFLKELTGAGYVGTALIGAGAFFGLKRAGFGSIWIYWLVFPIVLVPVANVVFGYFFAVRQMIYVLAPLAVLFAAGAATLRAKGHVLLALFLAASLYEDVNWFRKPREDWQAAAAAIPPQGCVSFVPQDAELMYTYFRPELAARQCPLGPPADGGPVVLAISPYDPYDAYRATREALDSTGYAQQSGLEFAGPRVEVYGLDR
jgi:uncharacterized membrane protein